MQFKKSFIILPVFALASYINIVTMEKKITYTEAFKQLQEIVQQMENADISVDDLSDNIKKATELIKRGNAYWSRRCRRLIIRRN